MQVRFWKYYVANVTEQNKERSLQAFDNEAK